MAKTKRVKKYYKVVVMMDFKKPISFNKINKANLIISEALENLEFDYYGSIKIWGGSYPVIGYPTDYLYIVFGIEESFAKKNMFYNRRFAPEKYLGYYLSRIARKLKKSDRYFAKTLGPSVFQYYFREGKHEIEGV